MKKIYYIILVIGLFLFPLNHANIKYEVDASNYFSKDLSVKRKLQKINEKIGGAPILDIVIETNSADTQKDLININEIENKLESVTNNKILSANALVRKANYLYQGEDKLPESQFAYLPLYYQTPEVFRDLYPIGEAYRISILGTHISGDEYKQLIDRVENNSK